MYVVDFIFLWFDIFVAPCASSEYVIEQNHCYYNGKGESASSKNIWISTSVKVFPPVVNSTLQFFMVSSINFMTLSDILNILRQSVIQFCGTMYYFL